MSADGSTGKGREQDLLGTVEQGKPADLLVVDGNPLEDIALLQNESNLKLIMKEGKTIKNELEDA